MKIDLVEIIALIVSLAALIVSLNVAYGGSSIDVEYAVGGDADFYQVYNNETVLVEFLVLNNGFGATVYSVEVGCYTNKLQQDKQEVKKDAIIE